MKNGSSHVYAEIKRTSVTLPRTSAEFERLIREHLEDWDTVDMSRFNSLIPAFGALDDDGREELAGFIGGTIRQYQITHDRFFERDLFWVSLSGLVRSASLLNEPHTKSLARSLRRVRADGLPQDPVCRARALLLIARVGEPLTPAEILGDFEVCRAAPRLVFHMFDALNVAGELVGLLIAKLVQMKIADVAIATDTILPLWKLLNRDAGFPPDFVPAMYRLICVQMSEATERERYSKAVFDILCFDCRDSSTLYSYGAQAWFGNKNSMIDEIERTLSGGLVQPTQPAAQEFFGRILSTRTAFKALLVDFTNIVFVAEEEDYAAEKLKSEFSLPITYNGLIDDVMYRYEPEKITMENFQGMIAKNIFFGDAVLLNDGYLMNHEIARAELRREGSLLRNMINQGFIRILSRGDPEENLIKMPEKMAAQGITSFKKLIEDSEWPSFRLTLARISNGLSRSGKIRQWPNRNMSHGYVYLMDRVLHLKPLDLGLVDPKSAGQSRENVSTTVSAEELSDIAAEFYNRLPREGAARTKFEESALAILTRTRPPESTQLKLAMTQLMNIANQCYHYSFGLALNSDGHEEQFTVDTTVGPAFRDILTDNVVHRDFLPRIPLISLPSDFSLQEGEVLNDVFDPASKIAVAKRRFLAQLRLATSHAVEQAAGLEDPLRANPVREALKALQETSWEYTVRIAEYLSSKLKRKIYVEQERHLRLPSALTMEAGQRTDASTNSDSAGLIAVNIIDQAQSLSVQIANFTVQRGMEKFRDEHVPRTLHLGDIAPQATSVEFKPEVVDAYAKAVERMR